MISPSQGPLPDNTQNSQQTNINATSGIGTRNLSKRGAADRRLRPRGHWDRLYSDIHLHKSVLNETQVKMKVPLTFPICKPTHPHTHTQTQHTRYPFRSPPPAANIETKHPGRPFKPISPKTQMNVPTVFLLTVSINFAHDWLK